MIKIGENEGLCHRGDPCVYCGTPHDDVEVGKCPAFDRYGPPSTGERFIGIKGNIVLARFDFSEQAFAILKGESNGT